VTLRSGHVVSCSRLTNDHETRPAATSLLKPATIYFLFVDALCNREDSNAVVFLPVTVTLLYINREAIYYVCFIVDIFCLFQVAEGPGGGWR